MELEEVPVEPDEVPGLDMPPGVGDGQLSVCAVELDILELLDIVSDAPALGDGHGDAFAVVV